MKINISLTKAEINEVLEAHIKTKGYRPSGFAGIQYDIGEQSSDHQFMGAYVSRIELKGCSVECEAIPATPPIGKIPPVKRPKVDPTPVDEIHEQREEDEPRFCDHD